MVGWSETYSLPDAKFVAFKAEPCAKGNHAKIYEGEKHMTLGKESVVVKEFLESGKAEEMCKCEMKKQALLKNLLTKYGNQLRNIRLVLYQFTLVMEVSRLGKLLCGQTAKKETPVLVQDKMKAGIKDFRTGNFVNSLSPSHPLVQLAQISFLESNGEYVILGAKGVIARERDVEVFKLTSLVVHSRSQTYGYSDLGLCGITASLNNSGINLYPQVPRNIQFERVRPIQPTAPPMELADETAPESNYTRNRWACLRSPATGSSGGGEIFLNFREEINEENDSPPSYNSVLRQYVCCPDAG